MAKNKIIKNASIVMIYSLIAKFSSFLVELLVASNLGVSKETDAFYMVYGIVQIIYPMISVGIWKVYLPEYKTRTVLGKAQDAADITNQLLSIFSFISLIIIAFTATFPKAVIYIFAPGFDADTLLVSESLLRIVIFIVIFNTIATFSSAILQSWEYFSKAQVKEIVFHLPTLLYLVIFRSESTVSGLAFSILTGSICASAIAWWFTREKYKFRFPKKIINKEIIVIIKQVPVACLNSIINQLNNVIDKVFASTLPTGAVTYLNYGSKLIHLFDGIFSTAISTALFPYITELVAKEKYDKLKGFLKTYIILICMILTPISFLVLFYSREIVSVVFGHGKFGEDAVQETALVLLMYGIGLIFMCLTTIINDIFYILKRTKILLWTTIANIISNVILDFAFVKIWGVAGLSLATTISLLFALGLKFYFIRDIYRPDFDLFKLIGEIVFFCCIASACSMYLNVQNQNSYLRLLFGTFVFLVIYILFSMVISRRMRSIFMSSIKNFSKGGGGNE